MNIQQIAEQTGHSAADVESMLYMMAERMRKDGVVEMFQNADKETQSEFVKAYGQAAAQATMKLSTKYQINSEFKNEINNAVYASL